MNQMQSALDRLEAKVDYQSDRIDALYALLHARGLLQLPVDGGAADELAEIEDAPLTREMQARSQWRRARFRVGDATGV